MATTDKGWLGNLGKAVAQRLAALPTVPPAMLVAPRDVRTEPSNTDGWYAEVARLPTGRGDRLQIWLDSYTLSRGRRLCLCYKSPQPDRARRLAAAGVASVAKARWVDDSFYVRVGPDDWRMARPLPPEEFRQPFCELYERRDSWSFLGIYLPQKIDPSCPPSRSLVSECTEFFARLLRSIMVYHPETQADVAYPEANRIKVRRHLQRERAGALVDLAKMRDEYTCQVCGINFQQLYGSLGAGFVEAHHRIPLSSPRAAAETRPEHLVAVCANCHRMLHRLPPHIDGVNALRKRLTRRWPTRAPAG